MDRRMLPELSSIPEHGVPSRQTAEIPHTTWKHTMLTPRWMQQRRCSALV
jgi:hypothetical protein